MASLTGLAPKTRAKAPSTETRKAVRDSLAVTLGGQLERAIGTFTAVALRWWLDPERLGVYTGLRLYLDNTNRSSLGIGLGAIQEIPILRAAGRDADAKKIADVAYTTNTLTCLAYALALIFWAWLRAPLLKADPLADEWTWGLVAVAILTLIKRYESWLVAILRAHGEFGLTAELDIVESVASAIAVAAGLLLAGFWGLLAAVGVLLLVKIGYAHARHPLRFDWDWDGRLGWRLMWVGLPILANTAVYGAVLNIDRVLILWRIADPERNAGLYSIAIMGTSWSLDLAGRIVLVMYTTFQTTLGRTREPTQVARQAMLATESQAPILLAGTAVAYLVGPVFLGTVMPRYAEGLPALRPLLPGMILLGLAWPSRQMLITISRPYLLCLITLLGLGVTAIAGMIGADRGGIVGVAWGMTIGYSVVFMLTNIAAVGLLLGRAEWLRHQRRLIAKILTYAAGTLVAAHLPLNFRNPWLELAARTLLLAAWLLPALWLWGKKHDWGGLKTPRLGFLQ